MLQAWSLGSGRRGFVGGSCLAVLLVDLFPLVYSARAGREGLLKACAMFHIVPHDLWETYFHVLLMYTEVWFHERIN